ncbi:MAG: hypothetical protein WCL14_14445 [Bacteroidota bacterium]
MKQRILIHCSVLMIIITISSCTKDNSLKSNKNDVSGYGYFPINVGHYVIYNVDSIVYNPNLQYQRDTFHYKLKELIESTYIDNSGNLTERIERYVWDETNFVWNINNVWTSNRKQQDAEKVEDNVRYVKLAFPVKLNSTWNGNALNSLYPEWDYSYTQVDVPAKVATLSFDSTLTVLQLADSNFVYNHYAIEQYAKNVGMIYKELKYITDSTIGKVGLDLKMTIESYNK